MCHKNEDISESVNSFDTGAIFRPRSGLELSGNVSVVSGYAFYKNSNWRKGFVHDSEMTRRAFLSSRVIQAQGKLSSRWRVKKWGKWFRKMKISQNL